MKTRLVLLLALACSARAETVLLPAGSEWRYLDGGVAPDSLWTTLAYVDTAWASGPAQLGYGDGDEATVTDFGPDPNAKPITTWFRHVFAHADTADWLALDLRLLRDDGAVVHLNGAEIHRSNMPAGPLTPETRAASGVGGADESVFHSALLSPDLLLDGDNVLAVEVHQASPTSSDLSFDLELAGLDVLPAPFAKGPRVIYRGVDTEMHVVWQLAATLPARIEWGDDPSCSLGSAPTVEYGTRHQHGHTIQGLPHATRIHYRVIAQDDTLRGAFLSAPPDTAQFLKFLAYGDTRTFPADHDAVAAALLAAADEDSALGALTIVVGDLVEHGDLESSWHDEFFDPAYPNIAALLASAPYQSCMGNHEQSGVLFSEYFPYPFVERRYWSFDYGPVHFAIVDQYTSYSPASAQLAWLAQDLAESEKPWKIVVLHEPGWAAGPHPDEVPVQERIQPLCEEHGVQLVIAGHNHMYARAEVGPVTHVTTGGGGAPLHTPNNFGPNVITATSAYHHCEVAIDGDLLTLTAVTPEGAVLDTFTKSAVTAAEPSAPPVAPVRLHAAVPNPFNATTELAFTLEAPGQARLVLYDLAGGAVRTLVNAPLGAGTHRYRWDGRDDAGRVLGSGVYLVRLTAGDAEREGRVVLVK